MRAWARNDLEAALLYAKESLPADEYDYFAEDLFFDAAYADAPISDLLRIYRKAAKTITSESLGEIMGEWGDVDTGDAARLGVDWLLSSDEYQRQDVVKPWRGDREAEIRDGYVDDRTFGCLRCWALSQPDQMQSWIAPKRSRSPRSAPVAQRPPKRKITVG
jgi:hypothetical protein